MASSPSTESSPRMRNGDTTNAIQCQPKIELKASHRNKPISLGRPKVRKVAPRQEGSQSNKIGFKAVRFGPISIQENK